MTPADEEFAQFVFYHFGGHWLSYNYPNRPERLARLPKRIADRVSDLARAYELARGGP